MSVETVARRYAAALADVVVKSGETETIQTELKTWEELMTSNNNLLEVFKNPSIAHINKEKVLENLLEKSRPNKTTANFLRVLLRNNRLTELGEINTRFASVIAERSGQVSAKVVSARPLNDGEKAEIQASLAKMTGRTVNINYETDESIIGGVVTTIGSTVYDSSVKTQLENLKKQMIGN